MSLLRYYHTLRHLRPVQFYGRLWHRFNPTSPNLLPAPALNVSTGQWIHFQSRQPSMLGNDEFEFLNVRGASIWNDANKEKLWLYNLHYFDDLNSIGAEKRTDWHRALINKWVIENPPSLGNGWEPYPTSLRIVNWVKWSLAGNSLELTWLDSLAVQVRWLRHHLEWHLLGNHLFANAKALIFAGLFFEGGEADDWLKKGLLILSREVSEQILDDGGHFELSPMYHQIILEDLLDLLNMVLAKPGRVEGAVVSGWREVSVRMLHWLTVMRHPDGKIPFFNDAAFDIAPALSVLYEYAKKVDITPSKETGFALFTHLVNSGYVRMEGENAVAFLDVAKIGPDYLPGHAHADTLSFELSIFSQRVVVNSGISQYGLGPERLRQRGTAAHSTVQINGENSSEVWGGFRVARRAKPIGLVVDSRAVTCAHDGYQRLHGKPVHRRRWQLGINYFQITDVIEGGFKSAISRYFLHPNVDASLAGHSGQLKLHGGQLINFNVEGGSVRLLDSSWHPEFGISYPNQCIEIIFEGRESNLKFVWD